jgi:hypothetical protein
MKVPTITMGVINNCAHGNYRAEVRKISSHAFVQLSPSLIFSGNSLDPELSPTLFPRCIWPRTSDPQSETPTPHPIRDQGVGGSNPLSPTNKINDLQNTEPEPLVLHQVL